MREEKLNRVMLIGRAGETVGDELALHMETAHNTAAGARTFKTSIQVRVGGASETRAPVSPGSTVLVEGKLKLEHDGCGAVRKTRYVVVAERIEVQ